MEETTNPYWLDKDSVDALRAALETLEAGFRSLPPLTPPDTQGMEHVLFEVAERLRDNYPYFHPLYAGQMLKPPHPVARLAYALAMWINPNNHALDGGRASSQMEKEAVAQLAHMLGWDSHLGHLCGGGTMANLEALWIAGQLRPATTVVASAQAHYTHQRISRVLGLPFESIPCDRRGRLDVEALKRRLDQGGVGTVVATIGTTAMGMVDPLPPLLDLRQRYDFRLHADAAYGGYFLLTDNLSPETRQTFDRLGEVDSIVIDPHKHGLQPYGCGCVLFRDPSVGRFYKHESPYTYFTSSELHLGEISLECSRAGASAVALWATQRLLPLVRGGEFARMLNSTRAAALALHERLQADDRFITPCAPELDIVVWSVRARRVSEASDIARAVFAEAARRHLHLALAQLPVEFFDLSAAGMSRDRETLTCLRSVLMKPEHGQWIDRIWEILDQATRAVLSSHSCKPDTHS
ncbi:MAG: aminotransferase class I/II-fold pyridoxal phosphate-dependent enzyme [Acidobacteriota bacterium]|nr:aminotransferase class I/II-fold pyridoxal phosphate-dependent enzyme [Blastocatellia bacterium]MDW8239485.1 aminotransferase class I/II-fold pyridoxal phosphate-dependent enzyme [Acidobacteriota bacterium]